MVKLLVEKNDFNSEQRSILRRWIEKPVAVGVDLVQSRTGKSEASRSFFRQLSVLCTVPAEGVDLWCTVQYNTAQYQTTQYYTMQYICVWGKTFLIEQFGCTCVFGEGISIL